MDELTRAEPPTIEPAERARGVGVGALGAVPIGLVAGVFVGAVEAVSDPSVHGARAHLEAALLGGIPGLLVGALGAALVAPLGRLGAVDAAKRFLEAATSRDRRADREPVLRLHAAVLTVLVVVSACGAFASRLFPILFGLQEARLALVVAVLACVTMVASGMAALPAGRRIFLPMLRALDRRVPLPLPSQPWLRYLVYIAAPTVATLLAFASEHGDLLGKVGLLVALPLVAVGCGVVVHAWRPMRPTSRAFRVGAGVAVVLGWAAAFVAAGLGGAISYGVGDRSSSPVATLGATLARAAFSRGAGQGADHSLGHAEQVLTARGPFADLPAMPARKLNVLWVIVDALRADAVGAVRGGTSLTPNLDRLARDAVVFTRAFTQATSTSYSIPSMLSGRDASVIEWQWARNRPQLPTSELTISERLTAHGYRSRFVFSEFIGRSLVGLHQGYEHTYVASSSPAARRLWANRTSALTTSLALRSLVELVPGAEPVDPFFLTVYYADPHSPYVRHAEFGDRFDDTDEGRYASDVALTDLHLGQLLEHIRMRPPLWESTVIIVTADHGEQFGEHGGARHGSNCHVETSNVPLLVRIPGVEPRRVDAPVALVDVVPTLIELVGAPRDGAPLDGTSLLVPIFSPERADPRRPIFCAAAHQRGNQGEFLVRSVRQEGYALVHRREDDVVALFHLEDDPGEQRDLSDDASFATRLARLRRTLEAGLRGNIGAPPTP